MRAIFIGVSESRRPKTIESRRTKTIESTLMQVQVDTYVDHGVEKLSRIRFDSREIEIAENIDQWHGADYRYFKVRGSDGNLYMVRHNELRADWDLTMYERARPQGDSAIVDAVS